MLPVLPAAPARRTPVGHDQPKPVDDIAAATPPFFRTIEPCHGPAHVMDARFHDRQRESSRACGPRGGPGYDDLDAPVAQLDRAAAF